MPHSSRAIEYRPLKTGIHLTIPVTSFLHPSIGRCSPLEFVLRDQKIPSLAFSSDRGAICQLVLTSFDLWNFALEISRSCSSVFAPFRLATKHHRVFWSLSFKNWSFVSYLDRSIAEFVYALSQICVDCRYLKLFIERENDRTTWSTVDGHLCSHNCYAYWTSCRNNGAKHPIVEVSLNHWYSREPGFFLRPALQLNFLPALYLRSGFPACRYLGRLSTIGCFILYWVKLRKMYESTPKVFSRALLW